MEIKTLILPDINLIQEREDDLKSTIQNKLDSNDECINEIKTNITIENKYDIMSDITGLLAFIFGLVSFFFFFYALPIFLVHHCLPTVVKVIFIICLILFILNLICAIIYNHKQYNYHELIKGAYKELSNTYSTKAFDIAFYTNRHNDISYEITQKLIPESSRFYADSIIDKIKTLNTYKDKNVTYTISADLYKEKVWLTVYLNGYKCETFAFDCENADDFNSITKNSNKGILDFTYLEDKDVCTTFTEMKDVKFFDPNPMSNKRPFKCNSCSREIAATSILDKNNRYIFKETKTCPSCHRIITRINVDL